MDTKKKKEMLRQCWIMSLISFGKEAWAWNSWKKVIKTQVVLVKV